MNHINAYPSDASSVAVAPDEVREITLDEALAVVKKSEQDTHTVLTEIWRILNGYTDDNTANPCRMGLVGEIQDLGDTAMANNSLAHRILARIGRFA